MASVMFGVFWLVCFQVLWKGYLIQKSMEQENEEEEENR